ncbi:MAG: hypothetical protein WCO00_07900 [Rhodospirillaceae bacterium]
MKTRTDGGVAFALGGLGGLNAHGVGFLEAARALNVEPTIISCTGGMITWVADWLEGKPLLPRLEEHLRLGTRFAPPFHWMNTLWIAAFGDPTSFRPAVWEYWRRWMKPMDRPDARGLLDRLWPAQVLVPRRSTEELSHTAAVINASPVPVVFNSFQPAAAREYLHVNRAAAEFLGVTTGEIGSTAKYLPVDERAVRGALWLYFYGLDDDANPDGLIDGTYRRQFVVSELHRCDRIYIARPLNNRWAERLPQNYFEIQDYSTDLWFTSAYHAELAGIRQINRLLSGGKLRSGDFHPVDLVEVEVLRQYGFFDFGQEEREVFETAFRAAYRTLTATA